MQRILISVFVLFVCLWQFAFAASNTVTVPANGKYTLGGMIIYDRINCGYSPKPTVTIKGPAHGHAEVVWTNMRLGADAGRCRGKPAHGMQVIYTPAKGYRGPDKLKVGLRANFSTSQSYYRAITYDITVK